MSARYRKDEQALGQHHRDVLVDGPVEEEGRRYRITRPRCFVPYEDL